MEKGGAGINRMRKEIDKIDRKILSLLDERMALAEKIGKEKNALAKDIADPAREKRIMERLTAETSGHLSTHEISLIYSLLLRLSRRRQGFMDGGGGKRICISLMPGNVAEARTQLSEVSVRADFIELRLDAMEDIRIDEVLPFEQCPLIVTVRSRREGGFFRGGEEERTGYLLQACAHGASYVDVEWSTPSELRSGVIEGKREAGVILSHHDLHGTSPVDTLLSLWRDMSETGAEIVKIVPFARVPEDSLAVLDFLRETHREQHGGRVISHCMGVHGKISRVLGPLYGSFLVYTALENLPATAEGQMTAEEMGWIWEILGL